MRALGCADGRASGLVMEALPVDDHRVPHRGNVRHGPHAEGLHRAIIPHTLHHPAI